MAKRFPKCVDEHGSFWTTLPGVLTASATFVTAVAGLWAAIVTTRPRPFQQRTSAGGIKGVVARSDTQTVRVVRDGGPEALNDSISVVLINVDTFKGKANPGENPTGISFDRTVQGASHLLATLLQQARVSRSADALLTLTQPQWEAFLNSIGKNAHHIITQTPFARLAVKVQGRTISDDSWLAGDTVAVPAKDPMVTLYVGPIDNGKRKLGQSESVELLVKLHH